MAKISSKAPKNADVVVTLFNKKEVKKLKLEKAQLVFLESEINVNRNTVLMPSLTEKHFYVAVEGTWSAVCSWYWCFPVPGQCSDSPERRSASSILFVVVVKDVIDLDRVHLHAENGRTI